jgi:undecaprenyl diphosphate synthase
VARAPLLRPTDAPPTAHGTEIETPAGATTAQASSSPDRTDSPRHVAIIMDGNRRWARGRGLAELEGHSAGVEAIRAVLRHARRRGIRVLTLYAFSRENWARTDEEVAGLFALLEAAIRSETEELRAQGVRVGMIGRMGELPAETRASIEDALGATAGGTEMLLNIAFNYAGRTELVDAVRAIVASGIPATAIDEATIANALYTSGTPDPDLVIRTGGEQRLSNFLIWQSAYAELVTTDVLWPDFGPEALDEALAEYASRQRRFGR